MGFRETVESNRPVLLSAEEQQRRLNKWICDFVLAVAKEDIIDQAKNHPQDGKALSLSGKVYLGTSADGLFCSIVSSETSEFKSFFPFGKKYTDTYTITSNGAELLRTMQSIARTEGFEIIGYDLGFGYPDRSEYGDYYVYQHGSRFTNLLIPHFHSCPVEVKYRRHNDSALFRSPDTNGVFEKHILPNARTFTEDGIVGVYVRYSYKG